MVSGCVVGTNNTATWLPLRVSRSFSRCVNAAASLADSVPVWSTTRPDKGGTATSAAAANGQHSQNATRSALAIICARLLRRRRCRVEIHLRGGRYFLFVLDREVGLFL